MKFMLYRDPNKRSQKIPYPAMQVSGLADVSELVLHADAGFILIGRTDLSTREAVNTISHLNQLADSLMLQLVNASIVAGSELDDVPDLLDELDQDVLENLTCSGADPDGLRLLLEQEGIQDE